MFLAARSCRKCVSISSAGGQLEQPSEVNSSTTTALRGAPGSEVFANTMERKTAANTRIASAVKRPMRIRCIAFCLVTVFLARVGVSNRVPKIYSSVNFFGTPPPLGTFVANKDQTAIRPSGDRAVEVAFSRSIALESVSIFFARPDC
jgi:hypothetical protein